MNRRVPKPEIFTISESYREIVRTNSHIGKKGYTIPKSVLDAKDYAFLKRDLMMKPFSMTSYTATDSVEFPVYRENLAKIYLPRFYGLKRYGSPDKCELDAGENIDVDFTKELREYQINIINTYLKYVSNTRIKGAILEVPCGRGKCLAKNTPVLMYDGSVQYVQNIKVGDLLMGDDLNPRKVLSLASGWDEMFTVAEKDTSRSYTVNKSHILTLLFKEKCVDINIVDYLNHPEKPLFRGIRIPNNDYPLVYQIDVSFREVGEYYGFEIDGNRRFVLGDYTITHNTVMALNIISKLKKKVIILVHKEFLMNQWIERIGEFMPSARIGKIQGSVFDVEGKDIVLGMIQTLHSRDFPVDAFGSFGFTVIDEVHRIGSEEFSKTLFKVVTPYMLGISATVERKDRLTKLLYMFIGDKIYSEDRNDEDVVQVRAIQFKTADRQFNETEYDFRGSPKYSTMITKLCQFGPRSDFIVRVLSDLIAENEHKQIMVLAHNRDLLTYLYDAIRHKISSDENTVGYYVGGMKEKDLKITENRRIVLATYAMAAEALDIKTLSTLVMATPKTDIEQSVGRILRAKGQNPIVVDITDTHDYLKRQWNTRRVFYKKCKYRILSIGSDAYSGFQTEDGWRVESGVAVKEPVKKCMINIPTEILDAEEV